jgi:uncharacterized protein related to proFAR isomerase
MYSELINKTIDEVTKIFVDAGVQEVPNPKEIREEFEIIDKVFITNEMIKNVELDIAGYLDHKYGTVDAHIQGLLGKWTYQNR